MYKIYEKKLQEEKARLTNELSELGKLDPETGEWEATPEEYDESESDQGNQADRFEDFEEKSSIINPLEERLLEVTSALNKIENGKFGICEQCGNEIEKERLEANPAASTCLKHK